LILITENDNDPHGGTTSLVTFPARAGAEYQIAVDTLGGQTGDITVNLTAKVERPVLGVGVSDRNIVLSWPGKTPGVVLEETDNLSGKWTPSALSPVSDGSGYS
jgi:hypothetical protein